jgi:hypothetical protein
MGTIRRSAVRPGRPPGPDRSSRNSPLIPDRAHTRMGGALSALTAPAREEYQGVYARLRGPCCLRPYAFDALWRYHPPAPRRARSRPRKHGRSRIPCSRCQTARKRRIASGEWRIDKPFDPLLLRLRLSLFLFAAHHSPHLFATHYSLLHFTPLSRGLRSAGGARMHARHPSRRVIHAHARRA